MQAMAPATPQSRIQLFFKCENLLDADTFSKSDPFIVVYAGQVKVVKGRVVPGEVGRTEYIKDNLNPKFEQSVSVDYFFERKQLFTAVVYDYDGEKLDSNNDILGSLTFQLAHIVGSRNHTKTFDLAPKGKLHVTGITASQNSRDTLEIQFCGRKLKKMDTFGQSDPYFKFSRVVPNGTMVELYRSEVIDKTLNPEWRPMQRISMAKLASADLGSSMVDFACFDKDFFSDDAMGHFRCSVLDLMNATESGQAFTLFKDGKPNKPYGNIHVTSCRVQHMPSFTDFLKGGWQINLAVSIDFTGSNGDPRQPNSLHFMNPHQPNQYVRAIMSVGDILMEYDTDKMVPAFGFGAQMADGQVSHFFHLNFQQDPYVSGIQGVLDSYGSAISSVKLWGPTNFAPTIRSAAAGARQSESQLVYTILLILTDGEITDMDQTINALVDADDAPMSIVIVGVGNGCDFEMMNELDGDGVVLRNSQGRASRRDLVQFVAFRDFHNKPPEALSAEVLREIPDQFERYAEIKQLSPPPVPQPH